MAANSRIAKLVIGSLPFMSNSSETFESLKWLCQMGVVSLDTPIFGTCNSSRKFLRAAPV